MKDKIIAHAIALAGDLWPATTSGQRAALAMKLYDGMSDFTREHESLALSTPLNTDSLRHIVFANPGLLREVPSEATMMSYKLAQYERGHGRPASAAERMTFLRELAKLNPDERLAFVPRDFKPVEPPAESEAKPADPLSIEALDAEIENRFGKTVHDISAAQRRSYHAVIRGELNRNGHQTDGAEKLGRPLSPTERINLYRTEQAAKR